MIEISRKCGLYEHWALCVTENEVIHIGKLSPTKAIIKQEKLETVVGSNKWRVNNSLDENNSPKDVQLILEEAQKMKDTEVSYSFLFDNCERMVTNLRYGKPDSRQGRQRRSTGPTEEGGETVSEEEAKPPHADTTAEVRMFAVLIMIFMALPFIHVSGNGRRASMERPVDLRKKREMVSEEEAIPPHSDTTAEMMSDICRFTVMALRSSTTGPTE